MPLRQLQVFVPASQEQELADTFEALELTPLWKGKDDPEWGIMAVLVVDAYDAEGIMKEFQHRFSHLDHFRVVLFETSAIYPHPDDRQEELEKDSEETEDEEKSPARVAIEELEEQLRQGSQLDRNFLITVLLSAIVAAVGLIRSNTAVVIGAMVIAPLLGPNMSLALGTTLGKIDLIRKSAGTILTGLLVSFGFALAIGALVTVDPATPEIASRTTLAYADLALALAAGAAGALAFTTGVPAALVGVMVAVALMPPIVCSGILFGSGNVDLGGSALLLTLANIIAVNLAAVVTFSLKRVRPRNYWKANIAARMSTRAFAIWLTLLLTFAVVIWLLE